MTNRKTLEQKDLEAMMHAEYKYWEGKELKTKYTIEMDGETAITLLNRIKVDCEFYNAFGVADVVPMMNKLERDNEDFIKSLLVDWLQFNAWGLEWITNGKVKFEYENGARHYTVSK